jgi:hypothetical protein
LSDVYDAFMQNVTDYRLIELYNTSLNDFETYLQSWLESAIVDFTDFCNQNLDFDSTTKLFTETLTLQNKTILAKFMVKYWMTKNINDITQINLHVDDRDFKLPSEANNLKEKRSQLQIYQEELSQLLIDYAYKQPGDWSSWYVQNFAGS